MAKLKESISAFPANWDKGWQYPLQIGAGGKEVPFLKDGKWKLRVWDAKERKHYIYDFDTDTLGLDEAKECDVKEEIKGGWFKSCKNCHHPSDEHETDDGCQHKGCRCMELQEETTLYRVVVDDKFKGTIQVNGSTPKERNNKAQRQADRLYPDAKSIDLRPINEDVSVQTLIQNVIRRDYAAASEQFSQIMQSKIATRLAQERQNIGGTLVKEALHESQMPTSEVQRVYDTTHNIEETEILCGVRSLKVNDKGQVVSFVTESKLNEELWHWFVLDKWDDETVVDEIVATDLKSAEAQAAKNLGKDWKRFYYLDGGPGKGK